MSHPKFSPGLNLKISSPPGTRSAGSTPGASPSTPRRRNKVPSWVAGNLKFGSNFPGKLKQATNIAVSPNGNVAIADRWMERVNIYNTKGKFITSLDTRQQQSEVSLPWDVTVNKDGTYFVTDLSPSVKVFDAKGRFIFNFHTIPPISNHLQEFDETLVGITLDNNGTLLIGEAETKYISRNTQEGKHLKSIKVNVIPRFLSVTADSNIIVSAWEKDQGVQILSSQGQLLLTLDAPLNITEWETTGVCYRNGFIYVCNCTDNKAARGVYCFSVLGECVGCMTSDVSNPFGLFVTEDGDKMLVVNEEKKDNRTVECSVKEFTMKTN